MPDLLDLIAADTRRAAQLNIAGRAEVIRAKALDHVRQCGTYGCTPDECAKILGLTVLAVRPRFTELKQAGLIKPNGSRRVNQSGCTAKVWVTTMGDGVGKITGRNA